MESIAWLLNFGNGQLAVVGRRELLHLVPQPALFEVPRAPRHCSRVLIWQDRIVPVWDMLAWLAPNSRAVNASLLAVVGYQSGPRQVPRFGAVLLAEPPARVVVADTQACELPQDQSAWGRIASSSFCHEEKPIGILDLPLMFSGACAGKPAANN
ncbi:MAG: hypothetical protein NTW45_09205 [Rhodocyclales bacterium]|nr:hypothetical protein [Rhodocyclales bacterium]